MEPEVVRNEERGRFELVRDGEVLGFTTYRRDGDEYTVIHTEVDPKFEGQGLGSKLARGILDGLRERNKSLVPECEFIRGYIGKHPEYVALVPEARRAEFELDRVA